MVYDIESFKYDKNGNRTELAQNGDTYTYQYGDRNKLEAVYVKKKDTSTTKLFLKYTYDANGNTVERVAYTDKGEVKTTFEYDTLNRVLKTTTAGKVTEYLYDNAGNRFIKKGLDGTTLYLRHGQTAVAMDIELPVDVKDIKGKVNRYVLSGELLAGRITKEVKVDETVTVNASYYHLDHVNSTKCVSDNNGNVAVRYIYRAFGSQLAKIGTGEAKYTYGGKELDGENGLYYFNARYYDAEVGRFISVDPAKDGLNWYVYCRNNPLSYKDPKGMSIESTWNSFVKNVNKTWDSITGGKSTSNDNNNIKTSNNNDIRTKIADTASSLSGVPYVWGGKTKDGMDCSGTVYYSYTQNGIKMPITTAQGYHDIMKPVTTLRPGDIITYSNSDEKGAITHVQVFIGKAVDKHGQTVNDAVINAPAPGKDLYIVSLKEYNSYSTVNDHLTPNYGSLLEQ